MSDPRFRDHFGGAPIDPTIVQAGHSAFQQAVPVARAALAAMRRGERTTAVGEVVTFLTPAERTVQVGRYNALLSVLLTLAAQAMRLAEQPSEKVVITLVAEPGPARPGGRC